jgi:hypothetical protein
MEPTFQTSLVDKLKQTTPKPICRYGTVCKIAQGLVCALHEVLCGWFGYGGNNRDVLTI